MKAYDRAKPIISIHIPKCAGTSLRAVLRQWFEKNLYLHHFKANKNQMPKKYNLKSGFFRQKFKEGICIHGHFDKGRKFGVLDYYPEIDQFFTFVRDPFEIQLSLYFYAKKRSVTNRPRYGQLLHIMDDYKDVNDYLLKEGMQNPYILNFMPREMTLENYREILERYFVYVGVTKDMQTSVNRLADKLNFPPVNVEHRNSSEYDEEVSAELRDEFKQLHSLEYAIYEYALNTYNKP